MAVRVLGLQIEGFGATVADVAISYLLATQSVTVGARRYLGVITQDGFPSAYSEELESPWDGRIRTGTLELSVLIDDTVTPLVDLLARSRHAASATLTAAITAVAVVVPVSATTPFAVGDIIYLEREAMRVTAITVGVSLTVERAVLGTTTVAHSVGSLTDSDGLPRRYDDAIYRTPHLLRDRLATLYVYDPVAGTETIRFRGLVEDVDLADGQIATVRCRNGFGLLGGGDDETSRKLNRPPARAVVTWWSGRLGVDTTLYVEPWDPRAQTWQPAGGSGDATIGVEFHRAEAVSIYEALWDQSAQQLTFDAERPLYGSSAWSGVWIADENGVIDLSAGPKEIVEVYPTDARLASSRFADEVGVASDHPLDVLLNIVTSTGTAAANGAWDRLQARVGLAVPVALVDTAGVARLRDRVFQGWRVQNLLLGHDGEELPALPFLADELLAPLGAFLSLTSTGVLTVRVIRDPGPFYAGTSVGAANVLPGVPTHQHARNLGEQITDLSVSVDYDWVDDRYQTVVHTRREEREDWHPYTGSTHEIEARGIGSGAYEAERIVPGSPLYAILMARWRDWLELWRSPSPFYFFEVDLSREDVAVGDTLTLTLRSLRDTDGTVGVTGRRVMVIRRELDWLRMSQRLTVVDLSAVAPRVRGIGPSGTVVSWAAGPFQLTLAATDYVLAADALSDLGITSDATSFRDADRCVLLSQFGALLTAFNTVAGVPAGNVVTFAGAWGAIGGGAYTPAAGDVLCYADYGDETATQRADTYSLSDTAETLGAANDAAHTYAP